jgi:hypothetical protein
MNVIMDLRIRWKWWISLPADLAVNLSRIVCDMDKGDDDTGILCEASD